MANLTFKGAPVNTIGEFLHTGKKAPDFTLVKTDLSEIKLSDYKGKKVILYISPSIDTSTCATSVGKFNENALRLKNTVVIYASADLPFAQSRFCGAKGLENVITVSTFRNSDFGKDYGVYMTSGPLKGLLSRAVFVINETGEVVYTEQLQEISLEPDYDKALAALI